MVDGCSQNSLTGRIDRVEQMPVYQGLYALAIRVETLTRSFGPDFRWLRNQVLRSSESVCANFTEGFYSQYSTEDLQSMFRSRREARETMTHLCYARDVGCMASASVEELCAAYEDGLRQLNAVIASVERKILSCGKGRPGQVAEDTADYLCVTGFVEPLTMNH